MSFQSFAVSQAILYMLRDSRRKNLIQEIAFKLDEMADANLRGASERVQVTAVREVLLPLCWEMVQDDEGSRRAYREALALEFVRIDRFEREKKVAK